MDVDLNLSLPSVQEMVSCLSASYESKLLVSTTFRFARQWSNIFENVFRWNQRLILNAVVNVGYIFNCRCDDNRDTCDDMTICDYMVICDNMVACDNMVDL